MQKWCPELLLLCWLSWPCLEPAHLPDPDMTLITMWEFWLFIQIVAPIVDAIAAERSSSWDRGHYKEFCACYAETAGCFMVAERLLEFYAGCCLNWPPREGSVWIFNAIRLDIMENWDWWKTCASDFPNIWRWWLRLMIIGMLIDAGWTLLRCAGWCEVCVIGWVICTNLFWVCLPNCLGCLYRVKSGT